MRLRRAYLRRARPRRARLHRARLHRARLRRASPSFACPSRTSMSKTSPSIAYPRVRSISPVPASATSSIAWTQCPTRYRCASVNRATPQHRISWRPRAHP
ncbi:pentapeptide repeat-containing protein [Bifidobacterium mongoliense]|uniref:pentapeptide repeat-containing protein n=1 Tax=Bifidobacterium mongoliense TaxID=518643 RepID=UPI0034526F41